MPSKQTLREKVIKGSSIVIGISFLGSLFAYLVRVLLSRTLNVDNYGLFYAVFSLFSIVSTYIDLGFGYSVVYLFPKQIKAENYSKAWNIFVYGQLISLTMSIIFSLFFIWLAPFLASRYFKVPGAEILIYIFCIYLISFAVINGLIQIFTGFQNEKYYSSIAASRWFLTLIFSLLFLISGFSNIIYYAIALCIGHLLTIIVYLFLLQRKYTFLTKHKIVWERSILRQMFSFAAPSLMETLIISVVLLGDNFFLTLFKGVREVGIYNVIYPVASIPLVLLNPVNGLILPLVSHLMEGEKDVLKYLIEKIIQIVPFIWLYFALFMIMFPSSLVELIFGQKWIGLVEVPMIILSIGILPLLMNGLFGAITLGTGKVRDKLRVGIVTTIISVILSGLFTFKFGVIGAVITASIMGIVVCYLLIRIIRSEISFQIPYLFYVKLLLCSSVVYFLVKIIEIYPRNLFQFIMVGLIYSVVYIIIGFILKVYDHKLLQMILPKTK